MRLLFTEAGISVSQDDSTEQDSGKQSEDESNVGTVAMAAAACVVVLALVGGAVFFWTRRRRRSDCSRCSDRQSNKCQ